MDGKWRCEPTAFYRRRLARLGPCLALVLTFYLLVFGLMRHHENWPATVVYGSSYLYNVGWGWLGHEDDAMDHLWSLAAEEQFYLVWPPLLMLALSRRVSPRVLIAALALLALGFGVWRGVLADDVPSGPRMYAPDAHADPIILGCVAGLAFSYGLVRRVPHWLAGLGVAMCVLTVASVPKAVGVAYHGVAIPLFCLSATIVVLACALSGNSPIARVLSLRPLRYVGRISYGLYLWHFPLYALLGWKLGAPTALAVAATSYHSVEAPIVRWGRRPRRLTERLPPLPLTLTAGAVPPPTLAGRERGSLAEPHTSEVGA